ncbi:hypothetical protein X742_07565 [Mesorhizobium sp. LNHC232B00]|nr:hypothetical protein X742_07565 [Mesorhizobium sp. LNHC232B00]
MAGSLSVDSQPMLANRFFISSPAEAHDWQFFHPSIWQDQFTVLLLTTGDIGVTSK